MGLDSWFKDITALIQVLIWPSSIVLILFMFRTPIGNFLRSIHQISIKSGPIEAVASKGSLEAAASLGAAEASTPQHNEIEKNHPQEIATLLYNLLTPSLVERLNQARILWIDDNPPNNMYIIDALRALGIIVQTVDNTEKALEILKSGAVSFDAFVSVSALSHPSDPLAGYILLDKLKEYFGLPTYRVIFYDREGDNPEYKGQARKKGAFDSVSSPTALVDAVIRAIQTTTRYEIRQ